jgi:cold-inducible RNA-binding protein
MAKKLYVGNLSYDTTEAQIRELFAQVGEITEINMITDRDTGRPKGFAFVQMSSDEAAQDAIRRFNGHQLDDRALTVNEARPREERSGGSFGRNKRF